jgi:hypothetical protein
MSLNKNAYGLLVMMFLSVITPRLYAQEMLSVSTSGSALTGDVSLSFEAYFQFPDLSVFGVPEPLYLNHSINFRSFVNDADRDAVRFMPGQGMSFELNGTPILVGISDLNDGLGPSVSSPYIWTDNLNVQVTSGDVFHVFGTATGGSFIFGNSASTFTLFPSGETAISLSLVDHLGGNWSIGGSATIVPEPGTTALAVGMLFGFLVAAKRLRPLKRR